MSDATDESTKPKKSWRDDPLSVFLLVAAILLGAMYAWDEWQRSRLEAQIAHAEQIAERFAVDGVQCGVESTGLGGETLLFYCASLPARDLPVIAEEVPGIGEELGYFESVVFRGADAQLRCPASVDTWPDACDSEDVPDLENDGHDH